MPKDTHPKVVGPVSSSLKAAPDFKRSVLAQGSPAKGLKLTRTYRDQAGETRKCEVTGSGGVWGKAPCQCPV